jgi:hypothetical protein
MHLKLGEGIHGDSRIMTVTSEIQPSRLGIEDILKEKRSMLKDRIRDRVLKEAVML